MANVNSPKGFRLIGGGDLKRVSRPVDTTATTHSVLAPGDAYRIDATTGKVIRCQTGEAVSGIVEAVELTPLSGPQSMDYVPQAQVANVIGIEDADAEFVVQADTFATANCGDHVGVVDATPTAGPPAHSNQYVSSYNTTTGSLLVIGLVLTPGAETGEYAKIRVRMTEAGQAA
jgi:hypothetical protein